MDMEVVYPLQLAAIASARIEEDACIISLLPSQSSPADNDNEYLLTLTTSRFS